MESQCRYYEEGMHAVSFCIVLIYMDPQMNFCQTSVLQNEFGVWEIFLPNNVDGSPAIPHGSRVKVCHDSWA